jgi:putative FmdB family regulatory protein
VPRYHYHCSHCERKETATVAARERDMVACPECEMFMVRQVSAPAVSSNETTDAYRGGKRTQGVEKMADERNRKHFREHELPRIIEEHGMEYAIRMGFCDREGNPR